MAPVVALAVFVPLGPTRDMDDLVALAAMAAGPAPAVAEGMVLPDPDLDMLVAIAANAPAAVVQLHDQRSWKLMEKARAAKKQKRSDVLLEAAVSAKARAQAQLGLLGTLVPRAVARAVGVASNRGTNNMTPERAALTAVVAFAPATRGDCRLQRIQRRAVSIMAQASLGRQAAFVSQTLGAPPELVAERILGMAAVRHRSLSWQWDETSQRVRNLMGDCRPGERRSDAKVATQVMMQTGRLQVHEVTGRKFTTVVDEPVLSRATFLETTSAPFLVEALVRRYPIPLCDGEAASAAFGGSGTVVLTFSHDRASTNYVVLRWIFDQLVKPGMPCNVFPHAEACVLHGLQLARTRPTIGKPLAAVSFSFTRFLRNWRSGQALRAELITFIRTNLEVVPDPLPAGTAADHAYAFQVLFGETRTAAAGEKQLPESTFRMDVLRVMGLVVLSGSGGLKHYMGGPDNGFRCTDLEDAVEKVTTAVLNVLISHAWVVGTEGRWTHTMRTLARITFGVLLNGALTVSLDNVRTFWGVTPTVEAQLAALVDAADPNPDNHRKLRLARICKVLCHPTAPLQLCVLVTGLRVIDDFMYLVFGANVEQRPSLLDLLGLRTPRFAEMQSRLCTLSRGFGSDPVSWTVPRLAGCDFQDGSVRRFARAHLLQLSASLFEHFELKWANPPYSLLPLLEEDVSVGEKRRRARAFLQDCPAHCCSLFLQRLRMQCPSVSALMNDGVHVLRSWCASQVLGIDFCERAHYALRLQLRSTVQARNATEASNKTFLREVAAEHLKRHGCLPSQSLSMLAVSAGDGEARLPLTAPIPGPRKPAPAAGSFLFFNQKMHCYKRVRAPHRPLTEDERTNARAKHMLEWADLDDEAKQHWQTLQQAATWQALVPAASSEKAPPKAMSNLWGGPVDPCTVVPLTEVVADYQKTMKSCRRALADNDPELLLKGPLPARGHAVVAATVRRDAGRPAAIDCCWDSKKNVCRVVLAPEVAKRVDAITAHLNSWVRTLGPAANDCSKLALLRGTGRAAGSCDGFAGDVDVIVLLVLSRFLPVMQVFSRCALVGVPVARTFVCPPTPFQVEMLVSPSRLCSTCHVLEFCTSDELAFELAKLRDAWSLMPLVWREPLGARSLLHLEVVGAEDPFAARAAVSVPRVAGVADLLHTLDVLSGPPAVVVMPPQMAGDGPHDDAILYGMPADFAQDIVEEMEEVLGVGPDADADVAAALAASAAAAAAGDADSDADSEAAIVEAAAAADVEAAMPWIALAETAVVDAEGFVSHPSEPWSLLWRGRVGKITTWPMAKPLHARSVSCKCLYHADCGSPAVKRSKITDQQLLSWLFAGVCEPGCVLGRSQVLSTEHRGLYRPVVAAAAGPVAV